VKMAMLESCALARGGVSNCWAGWLSSRMSDYGIDLFADGSALMDVDVFLDLAREKWLSKISSDLPCLGEPVRARPDAERVGFKLLTYSKWFEDSKRDVKETFWFHLNRPNFIFAVARFRMGSHWLNVETQRFEKQHVPRGLRICKCCNLHCREDELHMIYCPFYTDLRYQYNLTFQGFQTDEDGAMKRYMNGVWRPKNADVCAAAFWKKMGPFIYLCMLKRENHLKAVVTET